MKQWIELNNYLIKIEQLHGGILFIYMLRLYAHCFSCISLRLVKPDTEELQRLKGADCLSNFTFAVGILDMSKVSTIYFSC